MKTLIVGAGAIGCTVAVFMKNAGYDIEILAHSSETAEKLRTDGICVDGAIGTKSMKFKSYGSPDEINEKYDFCIIATKSNQLESAAESILGVIGNDSLVVSMQNGLCVEMLSDIVGKERTVGCMIGFGATMISSCHVTVTSKGMFYLGMLKGCKSEKLGDLQKMYSSVLPTKIDDDIIGRLYSKLIINCCINSSSAITGLTVGGVITYKSANKMFLAVAREGLAVAKKMNIHVPKYGKLLDYRFLTISKSPKTDIVLRFVIFLIGKYLYGNVKPSTLQSLERHEKTEIDIFNGYISEKGAECGVSTPVCTKITEMVKEIENGKREITVDNLLEFHL